MNEQLRERQISSFSTLIRQVFTWMTVGLTSTGMVAVAVASNPTISFFLWSNAWLITLLIFAQIALVVGLQVGLRSMSYVSALTLFLLYSVLNGVTLSSIFMLYTTASIATVFFVCAAMFGIFALYGYFTKSDLSAVGNIGLMLLIGLIVAGLVNLFLRSDAFGFVVSIVGVFTFVLLTAYDMQRIRLLSQQVTVSDDESVGKVALVCALMLYLDFINLFLYLLRLFGNRRK